MSLDLQRLQEQHAVEAEEQQLVPDDRIRDISAYTMAGAVGRGRPRKRFVARLADSLHPLNREPRASRLSTKR